MKTLKQRGDEFQELHFKCVRETRENGKPNYITHGERCRALAELETLKEVLELIDEVFEESEKIGIEKDFDEKDKPLRDSIIVLCNSIKIVLKQNIEG